MAGKCELSGTVTKLNRPVYFIGGKLEAGSDVQVTSAPRMLSNGVEFVDIRVCRGSSEFFYKIPNDALDPYKRLDSGYEKMWSLARYLISNPESYGKPQPRPAGAWQEARDEFGQPFKYWRPQLQQDAHSPDDQPQDAGDLPRHELTHQFMDAESSHMTTEASAEAAEASAEAACACPTPEYSTIFDVMVGLVDVCIGNDYRAACKSALTGWSKKSADELYADVEESCALKTEEDPGEICRTLFGNDLKFVKYEQALRKGSK